MEWAEPSNTDHMSNTSSSSAAESLIQHTRLTLGYFSDEFPHDDLKDLCRQLYNHSKDRRHPLLARLIDEATLALRDEMRSLPATLRRLVPPFETILTLVNHADLQGGPLGGAVDGVLLCVVQLATLVGHYEDGAQELSDLHDADACLAGLGTGLLSTAAVSLSPTLADVPVAAAQVIRIAFRLGVVVNEVAQDLQPRPLDAGPGDSWAYVVPDVTADAVQKELDAIHRAEKTPVSSRVFISSLSRTSVTISGPPARLRHMFLQSDFFHDQKHVALPVYAGPCHAAHLYTRDHVRNIVGTTTGLDSRFAPRVPVLSASTGRAFPDTSPDGLFSSIIEEIIKRAIRWDNVIGAVVERAKNAAASECQVFMFRMSLPVRDLVESLSAESQQFRTCTEDLVSWVARPATPPAGPRRAQQSKIAIVGMSCRMPGGASDTDKFWEILSQGLDMHKKVPADRFDVDTHCDPTGKRINTSITPYGCFIDEPGLFDAPFFNMSPREAPQTDPMQRLAIVTAYEALERAGYVANRTVSTHLHRSGTFYGQASDDYREANTAQEVGTYFITGGYRAFGPGRINYFFKFSGPSYSIDTACSSGLATIHIACNSLWNGDVDMAVAGGMNILTNSDAFAGLSSGHFLSKTPNACRTWDSETDGYCRADGVASVILKRLEDAEADNDNILGVILAAGTNHSAEAVSMTHPHAGHQADLTQVLLSRAGVDPLDVSYVEMHGTGTQAGDAQEIQSVSDVFAPAAGTRRRGAKQPLHIGAVKANVGHGEAVAGTTALVKVLMMLDREAIPPHIGIRNSINPGFPKDLDRRNLHIPFELTRWPRVPERKRVAVINNFSAAGGNTSIVLEEAPVRRTSDTGDVASDPRHTHVVAVSAKSKASLRGNLERLVEYLEAHEDVSLGSLAYTTTARRQHHNHRMAIATSNVSHLRKQLTSSLESVDRHKPISATGTPPVVFAFTGQGASHRSMGLELFRDSPFFRAQVLGLDALARAGGFSSIVPAVDGSHPPDHAHPPTVTQLALVCIEIALARYWGSLGVRPDVVVGHSLGEYAALHVAGVLSAADAISLAGTRAGLLEGRCRAGSHKMLAVRASLDAVRKGAGAAGMPFEVACINGPRDTVLSGTAAEMDSLAGALGAAGLKSSALDVDFAFHSSQTDAILDEFEEAARGGGALFHSPSVPVISPLLGRVVFDDKTINASYMRRATREPVDFLAAIRAAHGIASVDESMVWVEVGAHPVCINFVRTILPSVAAAVPSLRRGEDNWATLSHSLAAVHAAGVAVDWHEFHRPFEGGLRLLDLPTYAWNDKTHWIQHNGDWALTKGNTFYDAEKKAAPAGAEGPGRLAVAPPNSSLRTSLVHHVVDEAFSGASGRVVVRSDLMQPDFLAAVWGHRMNGAGVVSASIHADIALTLGKYLMDKLRPGSNRGVADINVANLVISEGLVAHKNTDVPQVIQISISTEDIEAGVARLEWHNVAGDGSLADDKPIATAQVLYGSAAEWLRGWALMAHLINGRIEALEKLAEEGVASRLSRGMVYQLFANSLVDYANRYRGMQLVVMHGLEAFADVTIDSAERGGVWTVPPFFIDSVSHLGGFVMNVSDSVDTRSNFCAMPGWGSLRLARPLAPGVRYRSYVKMIPTPEDASVYLGDVYVLQGEEIIGVTQAMKFRRYPRVLLSRFFSPADVKSPATGPPAAAAATATPAPSTTTRPPAPGIRAQPGPAQQAAMPALAPTPSETDMSAPAAAATAPVAVDSESTAMQAMALLAAEAGLEPADLKDSTSFASLGVDSLMSLVVAERLREQLGVAVSGSLFLKYPTVGNLRAWLVECYN